MNLDRHISNTQIVWAVGIFLGLLLAIMMGSAVANQDMQKLVLVLGTGAGIGVFLALGKNYWMLIPLSLGAQFPAVPLGGRAIEFPELAIAGCTLFFVIRIATRKENIHLFRTINTPFLIFMTWVGVTFALHPIGLALLGSSVGGARFYLKLAFAFASFVILSNRQYTERDMRWVLGFLIFGAFFSMFFGIAQYFWTGGPAPDPTTGLVTEGYYTWHQVLGTPAFTIAFLIFARWSPKEVFGLQRPAVFVGYLLCIGLVLLSGKRMGFAAVLLGPFISAIAFRQFKYIFITFLLVITGLMTVVVGQGNWFQLPLVAQRTVSWLPGDWDPELQSMAGGTDEWRAELRRVALENIKRDPIIGRGFAIDIEDAVTAIGMQQYGGGIEVQVAAYALGHAWHNTWLGYAADFGIPISIIQAALWITVLVLCWRVFKEYKNTNLFGVFALYLFIFTCRDFMASWTSGHSSLDAFSRWWMYGIIVAIYLQVQAKKKRLSRSASRPLPSLESLTKEMPISGR